MLTSCASASQDVAVLVASVFVAFMITLVVAGGFWGLTWRYWTGLLQRRRDRQNGFAIVYRDL